MATGSTGIPLKDIEKILECPICLETFRSPRTLPCSHTFCNECLETAVAVIQHEGQKGIKCPLCRHFCKAREYINSFLVRQFMELHSRCTEQVMHCYCCDKEAKWRCLDCKLNMCASCQYVHSKTPMSQLHKYQPFTADASLTLDDIFYCEQHHGQKLELHCADCQLLICMLCRATSHTNHACETVDEGNRRLTEKIETLLQPVRKDLDICKAQESFLEYQKNLMQKACKEAKQKYLEEKKHLIAGIEKQAQEVLVKIEQCIKENQDKIQAAHDQNRAQLQVKQKLLDTSATALSSARGCSLIRILTRDLMQKLTEEKQKPVNNASIEITVPAFYKAFTGDFVFFNPPNLEKHTRSFQPDKLRVRTLSIKFEDVMSKVGEKELEVSLAHNPFRLGLVDNNIWIPGNSQSTGDFEVLDIHDKAMTKKSCGKLKCVNAFCQVYNNAAVGACDNGLYTLSTNGQVQYKIADGVFTDVCCEGKRLVAVDSDKCEVQVFRLANSKWTRETKFIVKDPDEGLKSIYVNHNSVYVCYHWSRKIYKYSLLGEYIEEYGTIQGNALGDFHGPFVSGSDLQDSLIVCDTINHRIQVRSSEGEWQQYKLEDITNIRDILVVKERLFVLWGLSNHKWLTVYKINLFKPI